MAAPSPVPCSGGSSIFSGIPYLLFPNDSNQSPNPLTGNQDNNLRFWIHIGLVSLGLLIAIVSFFVKLWRPLPYGKHSTADGACNVPLRPTYMVVNIIPGFVFFTVSYFTGIQFASPMNIVLFIIFALHYLTRGIVTPIVSRYSENRLTVWIPVQMLLLNIFYHYINAEFIGSVNYCANYYYDPRFIIGAILFIVGVTINRISDTQMIFLRKTRKDPSYYIPKGFLFHLVSNPHYLGEGVQWLGWAVMTWSLAGLVWWLYTLSIFVPRSRHNHVWYKNQFMNYPARRKALIPFIY